MTRSVSIAIKIRQVTGLAGTIRVDQDTNAFLEFVESSTKDGKETDHLTDGQIRWIEKIWQNNFA